MTSVELRGSALVVGPGWLGAPLARHLAACGATVCTLRRSRADTPEAGITTRSGDIGSAAAGPHALAALRALLPETVDHLIVCIAPSRARGDDYGVYPHAARGAAALATAMDIPHVLYVSSTGVYDRHDGSEVTERSAITPRDARVQALYGAECITGELAAASERTVHVLRAAGLYGPQRDPYARFTDPAFGAADVWCNFSWRDDVMSAITHLCAHDRAPGLRTYNCADGTPLRAGAIAAVVTGRIADASQYVPADHDTAAHDAVRSGRSHQRINVHALLATGWRPVAPTVFDGLRRLGHVVPGARA